MRSARCSSTESWSAACSAASAAYPGRRCAHADQVTSAVIGDALTYDHLIVHDRDARLSWHASDLHPISERARAELDHRPGAAAHVVFCGKGDTNETVPSNASGLLPLSGAGFQAVCCLCGSSAITTTVPCPWPTARAVLRRREA